MSLQKPPTETRLKSFGQYYLRLFKYIIRDTFLSFSKDQIVGIVLVILILIYQVKAGLISQDQTWPNVLTVVKPYLWVLGGYVAIHVFRAPWVLDEGKQRRVNKLIDRIKKQKREAEVLSGELSDIRAYKLVAEIVHTSSNVFEDERDFVSNCPVIHVEIGLRFKNRGTHDMAIDDLDVIFCERGDDGRILQIPARGSRPKTLRERFGRGIKEERITGLVVKGNNLSPEYTYVWENMVLLDEPHLKPTNGQHFLRLTLRTVSLQKPYIVDIGVNWEQPESYIWSKGPTDDY